MQTNREPTAEDKVSALLRAEAYPDKPAAVEAIQTHFAWIFLTEEHAYKMKKAMRAPGFDLTDLGARHQTCLAELRLNRRLAPEVYLEVVPLTLDENGALKIHGRGRAVEWLVKMRRLSRDLFLDVAIEKGTVTKAAVQGVAAMLADFYVSQPNAKLDPDAYRARVAAQVEQNVLALASPALHLAQRSVTELGRLQRCALDLLSGEIKDRARPAHVIEAHGDLRPEHIYLGTPHCVIDCLEFSYDLRLFDPFEEIAYLAVECGQAGHEWIADRVADAYRTRSGDSISSRLMNFYKSNRAATRAKIIGWHLLDDELRSLQPWSQIAQKYLDLALLHASEAET